MIVTVELIEIVQTSRSISTTDETPSSTTTTTNPTSSTREATASSTTSTETSAEESNNGAGFPLPYGSPIYFIIAFLSLVGLRTYSRKL